MVLSVNQREDKNKIKGSLKKVNPKQKK